jgi:DNA-binding response OmpR family regulator
VNVLFVEDEAKIADFVRAGSKEQGFTVDYRDNGDEGYWLALDNEYDAIVLSLSRSLSEE